MIHHPSTASLAVSRADAGFLCLLTLRENTYDGREIEGWAQVGLHFCGGE